MLIRREKARHYRTKGAMAFIIVSFVAGILCFQSIFAAADCRSGWLRHADSCYHFSHDKETWINAEIVCERFDGALAEIETQAEDTFLQGIVNQLKVNFWVGGTDLEEEGFWVWMNSLTPINYTNWAPDEPNSYHNSDENCIDLRPGMPGWNDERCWLAQNYVCEIKALVSGSIIG